MLDITTSTRIQVFPFRRMHTVVNMMAEKEKGKEELRKRTPQVPVEPVSERPDYDPRLPYGPKVYVARRKKPDPWWVTAIEVRRLRVFLRFTI